MRTVARCLRSLDTARVVAMAVAAAMGFASSDAFAESAKNLRDVCKVAVLVVQKPSAENFDEGSKAIKCFAYVLGAEEMMLSIFASNPKAQPICIPDSVSRPQRVADFIKFVDDNPAMVDMPASGVYLLAMAKHYSCKK